MRQTFDHERLKVYNEAIRFCAWAGDVIEDLSGKFAARDQLDRASTSIPLNLAEGNGKRSYPDRCRFFDMARGSTLECAACLDVWVARKKLDLARAESGKAMLVEIVSMIAGLIGHFSSGQAAKEND